MVSALAVMTLAVASLAAPASAATYGGVKGTVTLSGDPLAGVVVKLQRTTSKDYFETVTSTKTDAKGRYSFARRPGADRDQYRVRVHDPKHRAVATARPVSRSVRGTATRNVTLKPAGSIVGKVTRADGGAPSSIDVHVIGPVVSIGKGEGWEMAYGSYATPDASGTFRFDGLPRGTYSVLLFDNAYRYLSQCYNDVIARPSFDMTCPASATTIGIKGGDTHTLEPQELRREGGNYRGTVTSTSGKPLKNITVTPASPGAKRWSDVQATDTRSTGRFAKGQLGYGRWQFVASDLPGTWETTWFGSRTRAGARVFTSAEGTRIDGLNFALRSRASLKSSAKVSGSSATVSVSVRQRSSGSKVGGRVIVSADGKAKTARLSDGQASATLTGLSRGKQRIKIAYQGTSSTANATKYVTVTIK
jgi:5-hydroxyisourate hydrolase-like protein (transthyretin family)